MSGVLPPHEIALTIGGRAYLGWTEIEVDCGIDAMAGGFSLRLSAKERTAAEDWAIADGAACAITLGGEVLITGYIDEIARFIDAEERGIAIRGRDKTADLVDSSAVHKPGSWRGKDLAAIARELIEPFGIGLTIAGDTGAPFKRFALQQGETVFAACERMARYRGLVCWSSGDGNLTIGDPTAGGRTGRIEEGVNVKRAEARRDMTERFSEYLLKGQAAGDDERSGAAVAQVAATAIDAEVERYRPLLIVGEEQADRTSLQQRAEWEAKVRAGRGLPVTATLAGWFADDGKPFRAGRLSAVRIPSIGVEGDLLVERVRFLLSAEEGTTAYLDLVPAEAWSQIAEPEGRA